MISFVKLVCAVIVGSLLSAGIVLVAIHYGWHEKLPVIQQERIAAPLATGPVDGARYEARVPIPGHPIAYCIGPEREINDSVQECTSMNVLTVSGKDPIPNPVEAAMQMAREACEEATAQLSIERQQEWCDTYTRLQLYGDTIKIQPAARIR